MVKATGFPSMGSEAKSSTLKPGATWNFLIKSSGSDSSALKAETKIRFKKKTFQASQTLRDAWGFIVGLRIEKTIQSLLKGFKDKCAGAEFLRNLFNRNKEAIF